MFQFFYWSSCCFIFQQVIQCIPKRLARGIKGDWEAKSSHIVHFSSSNSCNIFTRPSTYAGMGVWLSPQICRCAQSIKWPFQLWRMRNVDIHLVWASGYGRKVRVLLGPVKLDIAVLDVRKQWCCYHNGHVPACWRVTIPPAKKHTFCSSFKWYLAILLVSVSFA